MIQLIVFKFHYFQAIIVLDTLVCAFSSYCDEPFTVEACKVISDKASEWYPHLKYRKESLSVKKINNYLGVKLVSLFPFCKHFQSCF